ncbi:hypothetical protein AKJ51_03360 [candidate division MSBL1 archaeon SCGC-AAA382A20]|uniref:Histidine kinase/HSP90-like ATPase domain-containing protein n=1 Tax=candidate division MSBL1 archaeon SCGC-AAA382A20 TaxID=1698280 RepID=A0A133VJI3_9EURY|nr:hypothetical protein AKJ51_03360 [candidate division MSBL1 archaeon SCGC-AAA382A20]
MRPKINHRRRDGLFAYSFSVWEGAASKILIFLLRDSPRELRVFERGFKSGETGGSGLGMYLMKEIAQSYGGSAKVEDSELGGARVTVQLKKA